MDFSFQLHSFRRDVSNFSILKYRNFEGYLVTGQHSGTHWLKYMLSCAIAHQIGRPIPAHTENSNSNDFIGHPKHKRMYPEAPRIASTHQIPHRLYDSRIFRSVAYTPPTAVLVRDMQHALVSYYEKWRLKLDMPFSEFLKGDKTGHNHWADIWWHIRFYNRWGRTMERFPDSTFYMNYENLRERSAAELHRIFKHFNVEISDESIEFAIFESSREKMAAKAGVEQEAGNGQFVRFDKRDPLEWYSHEDTQFFKDTINENLEYFYGYDYLNR